MRMTWARPTIWLKSYRLVGSQSYGTWPLKDDFPIKNCDSNRWARAVFKTLFGYSGWLRMGFPIHGLWSFPILLSIIPELIMNPEEIAATAHMRARYGQMLSGPVNSCGIAMDQPFQCSRNFTRWWGSSKRNARDVLEKLVVGGEYPTTHISGQSHVTWISVCIIRGYNLGKKWDSSGGTEKTKPFRMEWNLSTFGPQNLGPRGPGS
jgi:hypothetical protein